MTEIIQTKTQKDPTSKKGKLGKDLKSVSHKQVLNNNVVT